MLGVDTISYSFGSFHISVTQNGKSASVSDKELENILPFSMVHNSMTSFQIRCDKKYSPLVFEEGILLGTNYELDRWIKMYTTLESFW